MTEKVTFDGATRRITVISGVTSLTVRSDLYSAWKRWILLSANSGFAQAMRVIGGDPIGPGQYAGDIYFMMNGWQIVVNEPISINGILYHDDGISPYIVQSGGSVIATVSSLTQLVETGGGSGASAAELWGALTSGLTGTGTIGHALTQASVDTTAIKTLVESANTKLDTITVDVGEIQTDVTTVLSNLGMVTDLVNTMLKYSRNRTKIDSTAFTMTVYDDDGTTPIKVFDLKNLAGEPTYKQVADRRPR